MTLMFGSMRTLPGLVRLLCLLSLPMLAGCSRFSEQEWNQYRALQASETARNDGIRIAFDPATTAIVSDNHDNRLVADYQVDEIWRRGSVNNRPAYLVQRLGAGAHCAEDGMRTAIQRIGGNTFLFNNERSAIGVREDDKCVVSLPGALSRPSVRADHLEEEVELDGLPVVRVTILVTDATGRQYRLHALRPPLGNVDRISMPADVLAHALGLARRGSMPPTSVAAIDRDLARLDGAMLAADTAALEAFLTAPFDRNMSSRLANSSTRFAAITSSPDRIRRYDDRALTTLGRAVEAGEDGRLAGEVLVPFVAALPRDSIARLGSRIVALFDRPNPPEWLQRDELMQRIGEIGPAALPVATELFDKGNHPGALAAICQIRPDVSPDLRRLLIARWQTANEPRTYTSKRRYRNHPIRWLLTGERYRYRRSEYKAATAIDADGVLLYVTMIRLGMRNDAEQLARHRRIEQWPVETASISPRSPSTVCTTDLPRLSF